MKPFIYIFLLVTIACIFIGPANAQQNDTIEHYPTEQTTLELAWLRSSAIPLHTPATAVNDSDLLHLDTMIGRCTIVALGENTHGASDIYKMKSRIVRHLVEHDSFTVLAIEANMVQASRVNDYIMTGKGDPKELVKELLHWIWDTEEMLDLVDWMRLYNRKHSRKIIFCGVDMQSSRGPLAEIRALYKKYGGDTSTLDLTAFYSRILRLDSIKYSLKLRYKSVDPDDSSFLLTQLRIIRKFASNNVNDNRDQEWLMQMTRLLDQRIYKVGTRSRDSFMADNLMWIGKQYPSAKILLWAHNEHVGRSERDRMGDYLSAAFKRDYFPIGFTFHRGSYTVESTNSTCTIEAQPSFAGTVEYLLHKTGYKCCLLSLKNIPKYSATRWLYDYTPFRTIGMVQLKSEFSGNRLIGQFDALIFIDEVKPTTLLHGHSW